MAPWGSKNETLARALVMAACCLASGSSFGVGMRTVARLAPPRIAHTRGAGPSAGVRVRGECDTAVTLLLLAV